jgi:hypothetical protein
MYLKAIEMLRRFQYSSQDGSKCNYNEGLVTVRGNESTASLGVRYESQ